MNIEWLPSETGRHQEHIVAHVVGATPLGYFVTDDALHFVLDIGFVWSIFLDAEMGLLQTSLALAELNVGEDVRARLIAESSALYERGPGALELGFIVPAPQECLIAEVEFYHSPDATRRRLSIRGEETSMCVETHLAAGEFRVIY
ncbi:MAG: hypothetical protein ACRD9R_09910 [Pyrinomonadaceae bacterium]